MRQEKKKIVKLLDTGRKNETLATIVIKIRKKKTGSTNKKKRQKLT